MKTCEICGATASWIVNGAIYMCDDCANTLDCDDDDEIEEITREDDGDDDEE